MASLQTISFLAQRGSDTLKLIECIAEAGGISRLNPALLGYCAIHHVDGGYRVTGLRPVRTGEQFAEIGEALEFILKKWW